MKISIIGPTYPYRSGISYYNTLLFRELKKQHEVSLYSFTRQYPKLFFPGKSDRDTQSRFKIKEDGVKYTIDTLNPSTWFSTALKIKKESSDLIIAHWWTAFWGPLYRIFLPLLKKLTHSKILLICHNVEEHENSRLRYLIAKQVLPLADFYIVHSEECKNKLTNMLQGCNVKKVFHPIYSIFNQNRIDKAQARKELGISGNVILFFGIIRRYKGLEYLLEALPIVLKEIDLTLLIVGEFWRNKNYYLSLINRLGIRDKIKLVGCFIPNEDVELYFKASDVIVLPYTEGTGSGVAQLAFGFNKPMIATKVGSLSEVIEDGKTGYLVDSKNPKELAEKIVEYFKENKKEVFSENIEKEHARYTWGELRKTIESFIQ